METRESKTSLIFILIALIWVFFCFSVSSGEDSLQATEEDYSPEEESCPPDQFWHLGGKRCVPLKCPKSTRRDSGSGRCFRVGDPSGTGFGISRRHGWELGTWGRFQPRGLALDPFHKARNGYRENHGYQRAAELTYRRG